MNVLLGVTGGISAYKSADIIGALRKNAIDVKVIMTEKAKEFITPLTLSSLSHHPVYDDSIEWYANGQIEHIELSEWADAFLIAPATANTINKIKRGDADNLLTSAYLAYDFKLKPVFICPAMNTKMYDKNIEYISCLQERTNHHIIGPIEGLLACGTHGMGKIAPTKVIIETILGVTNG